MATRAFSAASIVLLACALVTTQGCTSAACEPERLPHQGRASGPKEMFEVAQHSAREDCCEVLYGLLSPKTRAAHGEMKFCLWWDSESLKLPEPYEYTVAEILRGGVYRGDAKDDATGQTFLNVEYERAPRPNLLLQLLWVVERTKDGRDEPRLALKEQFDPDPPARPVHWNAGE